MTDQDAISAMTSLLLLLEETCNSFIKASLQCIGSMTSSLVNCEMKASTSSLMFGSFSIMILNRCVTAVWVIFEGIASSFHCSMASLVDSLASKLVTTESILANTSSRVGPFLLFCKFCALWLLDCWCLLSLLCFLLDSVKMGKKRILISRKKKEIYFTKFSPLDFISNKNFSRNSFISYLSTVKFVQWFFQRPDEAMEVLIMDYVHRGLDPTYYSSYLNFPPN